MTESVLYVAFVSSWGTRFDPAVHVPGDGRVFSLVMKEVEGQYAELEIVREQTGLGFLSLLQPKGVLVSWSPTGLAADARLIARGRIIELPGDLFGPTQTLVVQCAPRDIDARLLDYAKTKLGGLPFVDPLFSDFQEDDPQSYLLGRSESYHVHPATHVISTTDDLEPRRVHDMRMAGSHRSEDGRIVSSAAGDFGPPARQLKAKMTIEWTQKYSGQINVAPRVGVVETLDPNFDMKSALTAETAEGWSMVDGAFDVRVVHGKKRMGDLGTIYRAKTERRDPEGLVTEEITTHRLSGAFVSYTHTCVQMLMGFDWQQERSEIVTATLSMPIHETGLEREEEVIEMSLNDLMGASEVPEYEPGKWRKGDRVWQNGQVWLATKDHVSTAWDNLDPEPIRQPIMANGTKISELVGYDIYWRRAADPTRDDTSIFGPSAPGFIQTDRGQMTVRHMMMRLRKEGRRRMRCLRVQLEYSWDEASEFTLKDGIRFEVFEGAAGFRDLVGKIVSITRTWPEDGAPTCVVEVGVSIGSGNVAAVGESYFGDDYAVPGYDDGAHAEHDLSIRMRVPKPSQPYDLKQLQNPAWVVQSVRRGNTADAQMAIAASLAANGQDVRDCVSRKPTWLTLAMKPILNGPKLESRIDITGSLMSAFGGIRL